MKYNQHLKPMHRKFQPVDIDTDLLVDWYEALQFILYGKPLVVKGHVSIKDLFYEMEADIKEIASKHEVNIEAELQRRKKDNGTDKGDQAQ